MGEVKRRRPWEEQQKKNDTAYLFMQECVLQCIICAILIIGIIFVDKFTNHTAWIRLLDSELKKTVYKEEIYSAWDSVKKEIAEYVNKE